MLVVGFDEGFGDREPEPRAPTRIEFDESVEDGVPIAGGDAGTLVVHAYVDACAITARGDRDLSVVGGVAQCVVEQIHEYLGDE